MKFQRTVAPTAAPIAFGTVFRALSGLWGGTTHRDRLVEELKLAFSVQGAFLVSSGKAALTVILKALAASSTRRRVIIPAYTCFSVPSAIVKAGLEVVLCDVNPATLDFEFGELERLLNEQILCVLPTHLFGRPADVDRVKKLCAGKGIVVVEDAAQALGAQSGGRPVGTLGDIGFFSLGRGKNLTCGTGGIILVKSAALAEIVRAEYSALPEYPRREAFRNWVEMVVMKLFIHPALYWFPAGLPFLRLGETKFYTDFPMFRMDEIRARLLGGWREVSANANHERVERANWLLGELDWRRSDVQPIAGAGDIYLRLPVLVRDRRVKQAICDQSREYGAGMSSNYPATIQEIPELIGRIASRTCPGAQEIVDRLVTLPTHRYVKDQDRKKINRILVGSLEASRDAMSAGQASNRQPCSASIEECGHR